MATLRLTLEQVNFEAEELTSDDLENPIYNVVDANTDFVTETESNTTTSPQHSFPPSDLKDKLIHQQKKLPTKSSAEKDELPHSPIQVDVTGAQASSLSLSATSYGPVPQVHGRRESETNSIRPVNIGVGSNSNHSFNNGTFRQTTPKKTGPKMDRSPNEDPTRLSTRAGLPGTAQSHLKHLANASEALALQESVIGGHLVQPQPASPDVVAQVIASVHYRSVGTPGNFSHSHQWEANVANVRTSPVTSLPDVQSSSSTFPTPAEDATPRPSSSSDDLSTNGRQLHRFPPERIVTVTERKSGWFSSGAEAEVASLPGEAAAVSSKTKRGKHRTKTTSSCNSSRSSSISYQQDTINNSWSTAAHQDSANNGSISSLSGAEFSPVAPLPPDLPSSQSKTQHWVRTENLTSPVFAQHNEVVGFHQHVPAELRSVHSDMESERFELDSNYSERLETQSNFSDMSSVSGIEEEMFLIRKLLLEVPNAPDNHPDFHRHSVLLGRSAGIVVPDVLEGPSRAVVDQEVFFEVQRQKANLEGQLEALRLEVEEAAQERLRLQSQLTSSQALLKTKTLETQLDESDKENLVAKVKSLQEACKNAESVVTHLHANLDSKMSEVVNLKEELKETEEANARLRIDAEELRVDLDTRDGAVQGLKSKIAELHVEVQLAVQDKIRAQNEMRSVRADMEALQKSREWYQQQLHAAQDSRSKLQQDYITLQGGNSSVSNQVERLSAENTLLRRNLAELQQRAMKEKEVLMRHLETIEADMVEREAAFEHIQRDKGEADEVLIARMRKVEDEKAKLTNTAFAMAELQHQLEVTKKELARKDEAFLVLDKERAEIMNRMIVAQNSVQERDMGLHDADERCSRLEQKLQELQMALTAKDEQLVELKLEKNASDLALTGAVKEKNEVDDALHGVRDNIKKLDANLKRMKTELASKSASVDLLAREKQKLEEELVVAQQRAVALQRNYESYGADVESRDQALAALRRDKANIEEELALAREQLEQYIGSLADATSHKEKLAAELLRQKEQFGVTLSAAQKSAGEEKQLLEIRIHDLEADLEAATLRHRRVSDALDTVNRLRKASDELDQQPVIEDEKQQLPAEVSPQESTATPLSPRERRNSQDLSDGTRILQDLSSDADGAEFNTGASALMRQWRKAFEDEMVSVRAQLETSEDRAEKYLYDKRVLEEKIAVLQRENQQLSTEPSALVANPELLSGHYEGVDRQIRTQLEVYQKKVEDLQHVLCLYNGTPAAPVLEKVSIETQTDNVSFMKHVLEQDDAQSSEVARLEVALQTVELEQKERQRVYDSNIKVLTRKLKEVMKIRKKLDTELKQIKEAMPEKLKIERRDSSTTTNGHVPHEETTNNVVVATAETATIKRRDPKRELLHCKARVKDLQLRLAEMQEAFDAMKAKAEANEHLALDLEKEKGRLTGVSHCNVMLKQQTSTLEAALAERETTVSKMGLSTRDRSNRQKEEADQMKERIRDLEVALSAEQETGKELRRQIFTAKRESGVLRKQLSSLRSGVESANQLAEVKKADVASLQVELERRNALEVKLRTQLDAANNLQMHTSAELEKLRQEAVEGMTKDALLAEQMKSLSWHLRQKNQENSALSEKMKLVEERQAAEVESFKRELKNTRDELEKVKEELAATLKEKFAYQTQVTELRSVLKTTIDQNKVMRIHNSDGFKNLTVPESPLPYDDSAISSLLQQCAVMPQTRPLSNLQSCLNTLKQEMEILQKQLHEQTDASAASSPRV